MSQISSTFATLLGLNAWQQTARLLGGAVPAAGASGPSAADFINDISLVADGGWGADLLTLGQGVDQTSRLSNTLSTANDAIGVIGGMLGNIQSAITAAADPTDPAGQGAAAEQSRIDAAVSTIDTIASSTQFGGRFLLDGTFSLDGPVGGLTLPSFLSGSLGSAPAPDPNTPPVAALDSLVSGGANSVATGNFTAASQIVSNSLARVASAQNAIATYQTNALGPDLASAPLAFAGPEGITLADQLLVSAAQTLLEPEAASAATANSTPPNVLALIQIG